MQYIGQLNLCSFDILSTKTIPMMITDETAKKLIAELRENNSLLRKQLQLKVQKVEQQWVKIREFERLTVWKDTNAFRRARRNELVEYRYAVDGEDTIEYNMASVAACNLQP